jgi:hypothetical protein
MTSTRIAEAEAPRETKSNDRGLRFLQVARCDDDGGSGRCQPPSHSEPDAAVAAGHHATFPLKSNNVLRVSSR